MEECFVISDLTPRQEDIKKRAYEAGLEFREESVRWDEENRCDYRRVSDRMGQLGFHGLTAPVEFGGQGGNCVDYLLTISEVFRGSGSWIPGEPVFCTTGPGPSMLMLSENTVVKEKYLKDIVTGRKGCAIALTEPNHGSDLTHLETTAVRDGDSYVINGSKAFVTGATFNEYYATFVRIGDASGARGVGAILIEAASPGCATERGPEFLGSRGVPHGDVRFENVRVPAENLIFPAGQFAHMMTAFNMERLHNAAISLGCMMCAYDEASDYVQKRHAFGRPIIDFQAVYHTLADIAVTIEAHRQFAKYAAATAIEGRYPRMQEVTMAKYFGGTNVPMVTMKCLELMGGIGVTKKFITQRVYRDAITNLVAGGAPAVLRNSIAASLFPHRKFRQTVG
jgi:butyryl-CoA dehydrogenase